MARGQAAATAAGLGATEADRAPLARLLLSHLWGDSVDQVEHGGSTRAEERKDGGERDGVVCAEPRVCVALKGYTRLLYSAGPGGGSLWNDLLSCVESSLSFFGDMVFDWT